MMSISTTLRSSVGLQDVDGLPAVRRARDLHAVVLEQRRQREDVARVVVDDQHLAVAQHLVRAVQPLEQLPLRLRQVRHDAVQEERGLVEQPLGRLHVLEDDALRDRCAAASSSSAISSLPVKTTIGTSRDGRLGLNQVEQLEAGHVRQPQIEHAAVEALRRAARSSPPAPVPTPTISMSSCPSSSTMLARSTLVVLDDEQAPDAAASTIVLDAVERRLEVGRRRRLDEVGERAVRQAVLPLFLDREHLHRDVARRRIELEVVEHRPAEHVGQEDVERDRRRAGTRARARAPSGRACATMPLKPLSRARPSRMRA